MTAGHVDAALAASELRVVLGQLGRLLRSEHRLPLAHAAVLGRVDGAGVTSASALAAAERVRPQSMSQTLADLEGAGLVTRRPDPDDGRRMLVELAPRGREVLEEERRHREGWLAEAIGTHLSAAEQAVLVEAVGLIARLVELRAPTA